MVLVDYVLYSVTLLKKGGVAKRTKTSLEIVMHKLLITAHRKAYVPERD